MINEAVARNLENRSNYFRTRSIVEQYVREAMKGKAAQVRDALNDPAINKSGLARKIAGLSGNDDTRRSEISKIARGEWVPDDGIQNDILHTIASDTE